MEILCYRSVRVPSTTAHSLYGVQSCALLSREVPVHMIAARGHSRLPFEELYNVKRSEFPDLHIHTPPFRHKGLSSLWRRRMAKRWLHERRQDTCVVYVSQRRNARFFSRLRRSGQPNLFLLLECHDANFGDGAELRDADALAFTSDSLRREIVKRYPFTKNKPQKVCHHKIDIPTGPCRYRPTSTATRRVMYAGSILPWKNLEVLLAAHAKLPQNIHLQIVGGSEHDEYRLRLIQDARQLGISDRTTFTPFVPMSQLPEMAAQSDALVATLAASEQLRMPFKILEYLSWERPVVAPELDCVTELLTHGKNALLYSADSPSALAKQIQSACNLPGRQARELVQGGREVVRQFGADQWASSFTQWIEPIAQQQLSRCA